MAVKESGFYGVEKVLSKLNKEMRALETRTDGGVLTAAEFAKGEAQKGTPIQFGFLRNSAYVQKIKKMVYEIGYTAFYAPFVHEIDKNYRAPGTGWKFLEYALKRNMAKILRIIASKAKIK